MEGMDNKIYINGLTFGNIKSKVTRDKGGFSGSSFVSSNIGNANKFTKKDKPIIAFNSLSEHTANELNKVYQKKD